MFPVVEIVAMLPPHEAARGGPRLRHHRRQSYRSFPSWTTLIPVPVPAPLPPSLRCGPRDWSPRGTKHRSARTHRAFPVGPRVGHRQGPRAAVFEVKVLVVEGAPVDGLAPGAVAGGEVAALARGT